MGPVLRTGCFCLGGAGGKRHMLAALTSLLLKIAAELWETSGAVFLAETVTQHCSFQKFCNIRLAHMGAVYFRVIRWPDTGIFRVASSRYQCVAREPCTTSSARSAQPGSPGLFLI